MNTSPEAMREVIREIVRDVIREVVAEEMAAMAVTKPGGNVVSISRTASSPSSAVGVERGALTERHVRALGDARTITIGARVVITPLARERARAMGVEIIRVQD